MTSHTLSRRSRRLRLALVCVLVGAGSAGAADLMRFELEDGSVIIGEPLSLAGGVYQIRTPVLGDLEVEAVRVRRMLRADAAAAESSTDAGGTPPAAAQAADIQALQRQLVGDPGVMASIMALQQDPALKKALEDPELIGLVLSGNLDALRDHEAFGRLMSHPGIRAIIEQVVGPNGQLR
jgi:hypothetical protein